VYPPCQNADASSIRRPAPDTNRRDHERPPWAGAARWQTAPSARLRSLPQPMNSPDPAPILELIDAFRRSKTMFTAVRMGVFDRLDQASESAASLSGDLGADTGAIERLLDGCVGLGLLRKLENGTYENTAAAATYLVRSSPDALTGYILY